MDTKEAESYVRLTSSAYYYVTHGILCTNVMFVSPGITKDPWAEKVQPSFEKAPLSKEIVEMELMK